MEAIIHFFRIRFEKEKKKKLVFDSVSNRPKNDIFLGRILLRLFTYISVMAQYIKLILLRVYETSDSTV